MNREFLNEKIQSKFGSVQAFSKKLGLSRQAVHRWLTKDKSSQAEPEEQHLFEIVSLLGLTETDIDRLFNIPETRLEFRKTGLKPPSEEVLKRGRELAETFFKLDQLSYVVKDSLLRGVTGSSKDAVIGYLRKLLELAADEPVTLSHLLSALKKHNVAVFFFPLEKLGLSFGGKTRREVAFTAIKGDRVIIFVDTDRTLDQVLFDICHELVHLIVNSDLENKEEFCNELSQELIYPSAFLKKYEDKLSVFFRARAQHGVSLIEAFTLLSQDFDWSPMGLALALESNDYLKSSSPYYKQLMGLHSRLNKGRKTIDTLYFSNFSLDDFKRLGEFFGAELDRDKDLYRPLIEIRDAAAFGRLSPRRLSEILNMKSGDADELVKSWISVHNPKDLSEKVQDGKKDKAKK